jgi:hypothetical protein
MKNSEIARYWAARELTTIASSPARVSFLAPYACPAFTVALDGPREGAPVLDLGGDGPMPLREVRGPLRLESGTWCRSDSGVIACLDLPKGASALSWSTGS